jgi:dTDP-glucose 4,6-dehydratase
MTILVTGGAGFIGSNFILNWLKKYDEKIINLDNLTYSGNLENLKSIEKNLNYQFFKGNICDSKLVENILNENQPRAILNFAAESHVDRSYHDPEIFIQTNILGTFRLLEAARNFYDNLKEKDKKIFRFLHVSTDEVYGSLSSKEPAFSETNKYQPNSAYSASKASSDHLVRAWKHTYDLPVLITNCSNNYGPYQFPEKLIPLIILNALDGKKLPIYGDGKQVRDWLYVDDHARALLNVALTGKIGETYNIGGHNELQNIEVVKTVCGILDELVPSKIDSIDKYEQLITYVSDRAGHDVRYAIDATKIDKELGWTPEETFATGIRKTVQWYLDNNVWCDRVKDGSYHVERLGVIEK